MSALPTHVTEKPGTVARDSQIDRPRRLCDWTGGLPSLAMLVALCLVLGYVRTAHAGGENRPPVAGGDTYGTLEDAVLARDSAAGVLANDQDADGDPLQALLAAGPYYGALALNLDGSFVYTPTQDFAGLDLFQYQASDGISTTAPVWVWLNITAINDAPAVTGHAYTLSEDSRLSVGLPGVLSGANDAEGDPLTAHLVSPPQHGAITLALNGAFVYTPTHDYYGGDGFTYKANDGLLDSVAATVALSVTSANDLPTTTLDYYRTDEDTTLTVSAPGVLANDHDPDGESLSALLITHPKHGTVALQANGAFVYTPTANYNGYDDWTYAANDGHDSATEAVWILVKPVNDSIPVAQDDSYEALEDTALTVANPGVLANDNDAEGDELEGVLVTGPQHGTLALNRKGGFIYTPAADYNGLDTFAYQASDGLATSNTATVTITIHAVNDAPLAQQDEYETQQNAQLTVSAPGLLANDTDVDGDALAVAVVVRPQHGWLLARPDGSFDYLPYTDVTGSDSFSYRIYDGALWSPLAYARLTVHKLNRAPQAAAEQYTTDEDRALTVAAPGVLANDTDSDGDPLSAIWVSGPGQGTLTLIADGSFSYTPAKDHSGQVTFTYKVSDGELESSIVTATLNIAAVNDAPVALNDSQFAAVAEDQSLTVAAPGVLGNDTDVEQGALSATLVRGPSHGTVTLQPNGSFVYTPSPNYNGGDSFTYRASDGALTSNEATVTLTVTPGNDNPVGAADSYAGQEDAALSVNAPGVLSNDTDVDGQRLVALLVNSPAHGQLTLNSNGGFSYTPAPNFSGSDSFVYRAYNGATLSGRTTVTIQVAPVNDPPVTADDGYALKQDTTLTVAGPGVLANDVDVDNITLKAVLVAGPTHGALTLGKNGGLVYVPNSHYSGGDSFTYQADDGSLRSSIATVRLTIGNVGDPPVAADDRIVVGQGGTVSGLSSGASSVLANDSTFDPGQVTAILQTQPSHGTLTLNPDGTFIYVHDGTLTWRDSFTYIARQNRLDSAAATVAIAVEPTLDFTFMHTVGIAGLEPRCRAGALHIPAGTAVQHCYTLRNTGLVQLDVHTLADSRLGTLLQKHSHSVPPGAEYTHIVTETMTANSVSTATWTAVYRTATAAGEVDAAGTATLPVTAAEHTKSHTAQVSIVVSTATDDQDGDGVPDNLEGAADVDHDGLPNYLDENADGDGVTDAEEAGLDPAQPQDRNGDGIPDYLDPAVPGEGRAVYLPFAQSAVGQAPAAVQQPTHIFGDTSLLYLPLMRR
jgi:VCBS repeat-containing protein